MKKHERIAGLTLILLGITVMIYSMTALSLGTIKHPGPGFFPMLCGLCIVVFSLAWLIPLWKHKDEDPQPFWGKGEWVRPTMAVAAIALYASIMDELGYLISTLVFILLWQFIIEREKWLRAVIISLACTATMYVLFQYLLSVPLPEGIFSI